MGRYDFAAQNVHKHATQLLHSARAPAPPPWYQVIGNTPPGTRLSTQPTPRLAPSRNRPRRRSRTPVAPPPDWPAHRSRLAPPWHPWAELSSINPPSAPLPRNVSNLVSLRSAQKERQLSVAEVPPFSMMREGSVIKTLAMRNDLVSRNDCSLPYLILTYPR